MAEPAAPEITGNVLFYNTPEPLNSEKHAKLGLKSIPKPFGFAKTGHIVPVRELRLSAGAEFVVVVTGDVMTMPGLPKVPSSEKIFLNDMGQIEGLF